MLRIGKTVLLGHIGRNLVAYLALFLALGGTSFAAGKLLTGADVQDDSLTGADIVESSLAKVPGAANADQLGGAAASSFLKGGSPAGGALEGTYPNPNIETDAVTTKQIKNQTIDTADLASYAVSSSKLTVGAAAANVWGNDRWAPYTATQRGYVFVNRTYVPGEGASTDFESASYPVPLAPGDSVSDHEIQNGDDLPTGCGGTFWSPEAEPGHLCVFYAHDALMDDDPSSELAVDTPSERFGFRVWVKYDPTPCLCHAAINVTWAMTPPLPRG